jgi:hypothetical protein
MTGWERRIADIFIARFPASSAAAGGRPLRLGRERLFPDFETSSPDEKESFLDAAESLEKQGLVSIQWVRRRRQEALSALVFSNPEALFALAEQPSPSRTAETARRASAEAAGPSAYGAFFSHMAETLDAEDAVRGIDQDAVRDLAKLAAHLAREGTGGISPRALSIRLYADSKRLEVLANRFASLIARAERQGITAPDFSGLERSFPETMIAGKLELFFDTEDPGAETADGPAGLTNPSGRILTLPLSSLRGLRRIGLPGASAEKPVKPSALMIENKETFFALAEGWKHYFPAYTALLYSGGHPNRAVHALVRALAGSGFTLFHAGDLDVEGILILQELADMAGQSVCPVRMDGPTFDHYRAYGRSLTPTMLRRSSLISETTRSLPGITELLRRIEETGLGVEQEIIDYR